MSKGLTRHRWVETEDGSRTLFSEAFGEACHSTTGAKTETLLHYVQGTKVLERVGTHSPFLILEVGFGTGLGYLATREALAQIKTPWHFVSLELDPELVELFEESHGRFDNLTVVTGDARMALPAYLREHPSKFHAIYQDAFSPRRNPVLWTREWFELLRSASHPEVILSTYSSSSSIRKSLVEAGWKLKKGERFGPKRSSTRATLEGESDPEILQHLERSSVPALADDNVKDFLKK